MLQIIDSCNSMAVQSSHNSAVKALQIELKKIMDEPVEGFRVSLSNESNMFGWDVVIFGPPGTLYEGGYFKVGMQRRIECLLLLSFFSTTSLLV